MKISDTTFCKSRVNCYACRNNEKIRRQTQIRYNISDFDFECPENLPINAKLEDLPKKSQDFYHTVEKTKRSQNEKISKIKSILDDLEMISSDEGKILISELRVLVFPNSISPENCIYSNGKIGEVDEVCCGGTIKKKPAYGCQKHIITTFKKCRSCKEFKFNDK